MDIMRRSFLLAGGGAVIASAGSDAAAKTLSSTEKANISLLKDFLAAFSQADVDFNAVMQTYIAPSGAIRWADDLPVAIGPVAALAQAKTLMPDGARAMVMYLEVFARGPVGATSRIDTIIIPGKSTILYPIAGIHVFKNKQLIEYTDYILS